MKATGKGTGNLCGVGWVMARLAKSRLCTFCVQREALAVEASKLRATVGEISYAIELVAGRHVAVDSIVRGAYSKESLENTNE